MKGIIIFALILAVAVSQNPIPIPGLTPQSFNGIWYWFWLYTINTSNIEPVVIECVVWNITMTSNTSGTIYQTLVGLDLTLYKTLNFTINGLASNWTLEGEPFIWAQMDPIASDWLAGGYVGIQKAFGITRNPLWNPNVINSNIAFMAQEGYSMNATNYALIFDNPC